MRIGIIGAMDEEVDLLRSKMEDIEEINLAGSEFYNGKIDNQEVVLLKSGIGKVNAAMGTALLIEKFHPDVIINTGSAGGFHKELNVGDVVISTEVRHHDVDVTIFGYEYGQVPRMPAYFSPDDNLVSVAEKSAEKINDIQVVKGLIASGDSFMNDPERVEFIRSKMPELYAAEMEAAAIAQVAHQFQVPFVIIRSLSDIAGKDSNVSFDQFLETAAKNSAELILLMLEELKNNG
ncbi:5'-methylthioadenosine/S-adenosylhomocysteine nucleosidase [Mesobacillus sp. AQ2]|jgi:adenosylhomocysteine nucleosidase|uniref:5'-methylthioadenosine/S-adenosylhomocysteine nucleosidase n=1 Tax=Bacillaceae TaxID=186817 RepID=UPI0011A63796|nr:MULTISPECIES: 5'-methylthioadenosine/S-adenosylhomocysteine nucleosidase [Bacillaceae]MCM3123121.1 5'-methylthioadenosine/S-adenosylhomocysteine nucleosidase [Mesobacillus sp. MER 33]MCM3233396.1 5'-methylthioadenosine/S-adenosylhomocysteine nucleosidase [Mesobacillus sp. MER 48]WHX42446.1 5'-methylthioadenosine/S-adenosylhomocysteine nucleosidase [Mesobacillus sp. AQ2]